jgi:hypothetical protein
MWDDSFRARAIESRLPAPGTASWRPPTSSCSRYNRRRSNGTDSRHASDSRLGRTVVIQTLASGQGAAIPTGRLVAGNTESHEPRVTT